MMARKVDRQAQRQAVLEAALQQVPFDGWTEAVLRRSLAEAGLDGRLTRRLFPRGVRDLVDFFAADSDRRMTEELARREFPEMKMRERIATGVRVRLEQAERHREAVRRAAIFQATRLAGLDGARSVWRTADAIWRAAGDRATDYNWYSKRALLSGVYASTLLYWLADDSDGREATWGFLDRRIGDVMRIEKAKGRVGRLAPSLPSPLRALACLRYGRRGESRVT
jgi:ubiquinone biosynthesis protein COQ9